MPFTLTKTSDPVVSTASLKTQFRVSSSAEDTYIGELSADAEAHIEGILNRVIGSGTVFYTQDSTASEIELPLSPVKSITSVKLLDTDGNLTTVDSADYAVSDASGNPVLFLKSGASFPSVSLELKDGVQITYEAGYTTVPTTLQRAIKMLATDLYENRSAHEVGTIITENPVVRALISPWKVYKRGNPL